MKTYEFHRGDLVVFIPQERRNGFRRKYNQCQVIALYNDNTPPAARIRKGEQEYLCRQSELEPLLAHQQRVAEEKLAKAKANCALIVAAWESGCRTLKDIAEQMKIKPARLVSKFRQARRFGLLKETNDTRTNTNIEQPVGAILPECGGPRLSQPQ